MGLKDFFKSIAASPALLPHIIRIPDENTDVHEGKADIFEPQQHYFTVRINEMFLSESRKWFSEIEPMVVCLTSYTYGSQEIDNPFIVGRSLLKNKMENIPEGMLFYDTRVAGIHPYSGGRLIVNIVLCQAVTKDYLANTLEFMEKITGILNDNIPVLMGSYAKIANVVISSIDKLFDSKAVQPLFGFRQEFDRDSNDKVAPGYYVMIDKSEENWKPENFFIKENRLFYGKDLASAKPFRNDEYVSFSITRSDRRTDERTLPVWQSYNNILDEMTNVSEISEEHKNKIKNMLRVLNIELKQSADLTEPQARDLIQKFEEEVKNSIAPKYNWSAEKKKSKDFWDEMDDKINEI